MARYKESFTLYPRPRPKGPPVWYYRTYDEFGERTSGHSTGLTSKTLARQYCMELYRQGRLTPSSDPYFRDYAAPWWKWDECPYVRHKRERSPEGRPTISRRYVDEQRRILEQHLVPVFGPRRLSAITPGRIEAWMSAMLHRGLSAKRVNNVSGCLRKMLSEAVRRGLLQNSPFARVELLPADTPSRMLLSLEEVRALFAPEALESAWKGHVVYRALNLTAAATGCRQGELLALRREDVREGYLHIEHSWHSRYGLGPTKTRQIRDVPIPRIVQEVLAFPWNGFVFSVSGGKRPVTGSNAGRALHTALEVVGVTREEAARRRVNFHAWRHWFNTMLRSRGIATAKVQRLTGHKSLAMTDRYTGFQLGDYTDVAAVQKAVFP